MKLMIVEDSPKMRNMIKEMFRECFEKIYECTEGSEAINTYNIKNPDWVFMDIKMEGMDGITATKKIKSEHPEAKIVIVTGIDDAEFRNAAEYSGACGYVLKENLYDLFGVIGV